MSTVSVSATSTLLASGIFATEPGQRLLHILEVLGKRGFRALYDKCNGDASSSYYQTGLQRVHLWSGNVIDEDIDFVRRTCPDVDETYEACFVRYVADRYRGQAQRPTVRCPPMQDFARRFLEALGQHDGLVTGDYFARRDPILVRVACMDAARQAMYTLVTTENVRVELVSEVGSQVAPSQRGGSSVVSSTAPRPRDSRSSGNEHTVREAMADSMPAAPEHPVPPAPSVPSASEHHAPPEAPAPASPPPRSVASHQATNASNPPPPRAASSVASSVRGRSFVPSTRHLSDLSERDDVLPSDSVSQVGHTLPTTVPSQPEPDPPRQTGHMPNPPPSSYEDDKVSYTSHASRRAPSHVSDARSHRSSHRPLEEPVRSASSSTQTPVHSSFSVDDRHDFTMISHDDDGYVHPADAPRDDPRDAPRDAPRPTHDPTTTSLPTRQHAMVTMQQHMPTEPVYSRASSNASSVRIGMKKIRSPRS